MDVAMITMDTAKARAAFKAYSTAVKQRYDADYDALAKGYKSIAQGRSVIDLYAAMKQAGVDRQLRPRLAIARANWEWCYFDGRYGGLGRQWQFRDESWHRSKYFTRKYINLKAEIQATDRTLKARVPLVPPQYRPRGSLGNYYILWEADWEDMPVDPILLRHLGGSLYAVLALWDLTDLERAVMRK